MSELAMIKLELNIEQINFIINSLGEQPTKTNAWIVRQAIIEQAAPQVPKEDEEPTVQ